MPVFPWATRKPAPEPSENVDSGSEFSYRSSIRGMHDGADDRHFARYCPVSNPLSYASIYALSLMSSGNGWAPLEMLGVKGDPQQHFEQGVTIGDVGYFHKSGRFSYLFNIFYPRDHEPMQTENVPRNFVPIEPPLSEWEVRKNPSHFAPGAVVASEGVRFTQTSESPRKILCSSSAREGAVVVFPTGGEREDLADLSQLYPYLKEHAVDWYQSLNLYSGSENILPSPPGMNGTLFVVTGCDRARSCATAVFPRHAHTAGSLHTFAYDETATRSWSTSIPSASTTAASESQQPGNRFSIFIRGITIALGRPAWIRHLPHIPEEDIPVYIVLAKPLFQPQDRLGKLLERLKGLDKLPVPEDPTEIMFHPAMVLLQTMIESLPAVDVAIVEDSLWCPLVDGHNLTHAQIIELMTKVLRFHDVSVVDGLATLVKKPEQALTLTQTLAMLWRSLYLWRSTFHDRATHSLSMILHRPRSR